MRRRLRGHAVSLTAAVAMVGFLSAAAAAQVGTSVLTGTVVDGTGAVIPGATVTATQSSTGAQRTVPTNETGQFRMPALPPGSYVLKVDLAGFKPVSMTDITLVSSETRDLGKLVMEVGTQTEMVSVVAEVTPVQVASSERSATVTGDQLQNIQLKGRDVFGFASTLPGVLDTNSSRDFATWTSMRDISINGAPSGSKNVLVDGVNVIDEGANQNAFVNPNIDAVAEVRVLANGFQAEHGRNSGGTINIITKGGTNQLRGSGWYNLRRDRFNENSFFNKAQGLPKPLERIDIAGYSIGGPVVIPKLVDGRQRLFFFGSQEFTDDERPTGAVTANLPTAAERLGDFSDTRQTNGNLLVIIDPLTGQPFSGNRIPASRINPTGSALLNLLPLPNGYVNPQPGQQYTANFQVQETPVHNRRNDVLRIDAVLTNNTRLFVKFIKDREDTTSYSLYSPGVGSLLNFVPGWVLTGNMTQVLRPTLVNELTVGYGHNNFGNRQADRNEEQYYRSAAGIDPPRLRPFAPAGSDPAIAGSQNDEWPYLPQLSFNGGNRANLGFFRAGTTGGRTLPQANRNDRISVQDDVSYSRGRHNFKTGAYVEYSSKTEPNLGSNYMGNFNFGSTATNPLDTGYGYANALLGVFQSYTESTNRANPDMRQWQIEGYVQDNWRMSSRLTLDYGVRLTHSGPYSERYANAGFFPELYDPRQAPRLYKPVCLDGRPGNQTCPQNLRAALDPGTGAIVSNAYAGNIVPGSGNPTNGIQTGGSSGSGDYYDYPTVVAAPRAGFAWNVTGDGRTALRASVGTFYNRLGKAAYNPFLGSSPVVFDHVVRNATIGEIPSLALATVISPPSGVGVAEGERDLERAYEANVTFQRDLGFQTVVEVGYVMNLVRHTNQNKDINPVPVYAYADPANLFNGAAMPANFVRTRYPGLGALQNTDTDQDSLNYHAMQMQVQRRLHKGLQLGLAYTLSKAEGMQGWDPYTEDQRARYYGPTATDRRHILNVNYSYQVPSLTRRGLLMRVLGDWQVSGITKFLTGAPVSPTCSSTNAGIASTDPSLSGIAVRCQLVGDPFSGFAESGDPLTSIHFNAAAFAMAQPLSPTVGNFGDTPIGILRQPSWSNWDITLARRIPIRLGPRANVRIQVQAYNVFNQVQFTTLGTTYQFSGANNSVNTNTTTGRYTATTLPRQMAFTLRMEF